MSGIASEAGIATMVVDVCLTHCRIRIFLGTVPASLSRTTYNMWQSGWAFSAEGDKILV